MYLSKCAEGCFSEMHLQDNQDFLSCIWQDKCTAWKCYIYLTSSFCCSVIWCAAVIPYADFDIINLRFEFDVPVSWAWLLCDVEAKASSSITVMSLACCGAWEGKLSRSKINNVASIFFEPERGLHLGWKSQFEWGILWGMLMWMKVCYQSERIAPLLLQI